MKKALTLALAALLSLTTAATSRALAYGPPANANFASANGVPFGLVLDGRPLTRPVARQVHVDLLQPGQHWADFSVPAPRGGAFRFRTAVWLEPGLETSFVLVFRPGWGPQLRQVGAVALGGPGCAAPGGYGSPYGPQGGYYNNGYNQSNAYDPGYGYQGSSPTDSYNQGGQPGYGGGYNPGPGAGYYPGSAVTNLRPLAPADVDALNQNLRQRPFDDTRLSTAKQALAQSSLRAEDLQRLLGAFSFETSRVELAKFAYPHVVDQQNFYRVYDAFQFDSSVQEVQRSLEPQI